MHNYKALTSNRPLSQQQLHEFLLGSSVKCPAKTKAAQQRTKQRGISIPRLSAHAHPHHVTLNIIKHSPSVTHNTTKHSSGAMLLKQTLRLEPQGPRRVAEEPRRRMCGRPRTGGLYSERPESGKRTQHDPHVFLTPANPTKRQREQIPLQRKLPLRYLSSLRQTSGPGGLFS